MALELVEGGGGGLVEEQGHGARLVGFGDQDGVAAQHHRLVLHLVPVNPGEDLGVPAVGGAVGDAVSNCSLKIAASQAGSARPRSSRCHGLGSLIGFCSHNNKKCMSLCNFRLFCCSSGCVVCSRCEDGFGGGDN
uniref:Uncharacterized protein n=1 Tax=Strix occidentalis caurina TaxID=311401 RepID=A0A8D0EPB7_STROC